MMAFLEQYVLVSYNYWVCILLMVTGFYGVINGGNLVKKLMGLGIFQTSVLLFYISVGHVHGARVPILEKGETFYVNPLPHVLMLTAIVVGVATMAVGLALVVRIKEAYGVIEEDEILDMDAAEGEEKPKTVAKKTGKGKARGSTRTAMRRKRS